MASESPSATTTRSALRRVLDALQGVWKRSSITIVVGFFLVLPLIAVCVWLHGNDRWAPVYDHAIIEMRVRDVGTVDTPLLGPPGRLSRSDMPQGYGSHPGPLSFYLLAPVYRLLGGSFWALRASTAVLNALAIISTLLIAKRRAGTPTVIAVGLAIGLLELGYGLLRLTEPWNPHVAMLWFVVCLTSVWSVACDDVRMLPVVAFSASFCAQTHISYVPLCGGLGLLATLLAGASWLRGRRRGSDVRQHARAFLLAASVTVIVWAPPLVEQGIHDPGNVAILSDYFMHPSAPAVGFSSAAAVLMKHLDAWHLTLHQAVEPGTLGIILSARQPSLARGIVMLVLFGASAALAVQLKNRVLLALHGVLAASVVLAWIAISRIIAFPWPYLTFWAWAIGVGLLLAVASCAALGIERWLPERWRNRSRRLAVLGMAGVSLCCVRLLVETTTAGSSTPAASAQLHELALQTAAQLRRGIGAAKGETGRYLITWSDAFYFGAQGIGLLNELDRNGLHVGIAEEYGATMTKRRVLARHDATARIHLATGRWVPKWRKTRGAVEVAFSDPRSAEAREEYGRLRKDVISAFRKQGREDLVRALDWNLPAARDGAGDFFVGLAIDRMAQLGGPAAVFILPIDAPLVP